MHSKYSNAVSASSMTASNPHPQKDALFLGQSFEEDLARARVCFGFLQRLFQELEEVRPLELLKGQGDRVNFLLTKQARIIAMTCTHAAMKRKEFLRLALQYDTLVIEEAAQILDIETFIPMTLQAGRTTVVGTGNRGDGNSGDGNSNHGNSNRQANSNQHRLKRVILIGDHFQLPPVVTNPAFARFSRMEQSLFARIARLGAPTVCLDRQGRMRPTLADLFRWRYKGLGDLPVVCWRKEE
eukprot:CAMPEP_0175072536 /NCGR_PEP_ID=MMETSP0052_2-20121109/19974_1 /TAXON_ID=51329 ORGANISM="Polytomella parva, Strain SAG 63-3" /NCGR_SAMPLE_ID=MMETSP0052_2 /ASSEMBLY_ACC=CAM_ASM_000194 /LENGTH=240 /DNA_ID=CAMNT_0016340071 /DNA_START=95 /DNA_END=814 /DNA_ORIENTATION=+